MTMTVTIPTTQTPQRPLFSRRNPPLHTPTTIALQVRCLLFDIYLDCGDRGGPTCDTPIQSLHPFYACVCSCSSFVAGGKGGGGDSLGHAGLVVEGQGQHTPHPEQADLGSGESSTDRLGEKRHGSCCRHSPPREIYRIY